MMLLKKLYMINWLKTLINVGNFLYLYESQNYLVFEPLSSYFTFKNFKIDSWRSKEMSDESIKPPFTIGNSFYPEIFVIMVKEV